ncbi:MAG: fatty acid--CoA ligase family protein, partial [Candidatus Dormibacteraeota bacterium]|nr:fatty acid--CoA ligase family protein [Candidatus Dormibacteraeota bacterium]
LTSGTTGLPKLASLHAGLKAVTAAAFTERLGIGPADRVLSLAPLMQGIGGMSLFALRRGATLVMLGEPRFSAEHALTVAAGRRATVLVGVPTHVIRMLAAPELATTDLSSARCTAVAGAPMPPAVAEAWERRSGYRVCIFYGSMDAGQLAVGSPEDPPLKRWHTVGRVHDRAEALITPDGEICMRGPTVQRRYWGEARGPLAADGWAHMGDLGFIDADGFLHVVGRVKDVIIRGGTNINPNEVENAIREHQHVVDACVVGRPDPDLGERVVAFVVSSGPLSLESARAHLARLGLARYKWPEAVIPLPEIPVRGPGKPDRAGLREQAAALARSFDVSGRLPE